MKKLKPCLTELLTFRAALLLSALMMRHKMREVSLTLILYTHNKVDLFIYNPVDGKRREGDFFFFFCLKWICQHTKQRKEQQWVKQWVLVFQRSTCPIIYTSLTGAILKSVTGGKLFVSKHLAHSESTSTRVRVINDFWPHCVEVAN